MHWAAYKGFLELLGYLTYQVPSLISVADNYGQTPLHLSAAQGQLAAVQYLVLDSVAPSDLATKDRNGAMAVDLALKKKHFQVDTNCYRLVTTLYCLLF